jgi:CheY-like chemotaxis protein
MTETIQDIGTFFNSGESKEVQPKKNLVMIIDDNKEVLDALSIILENFYELTLCYSFEEAIQKMKPEIKVALLDIKMAYKDGIEIFGLLKERYPNLRIIFHSAYAGSDKNVKLAESLPHFGYLTKGEYNVTELLNKLQEASK